MRNGPRVEGIVAGLLAGFVLFRNAPALVGRPAWDGGFVYLALLVAAGALTALVDRRDVWPGPAGIFAGQALAILLDAARGALSPEGPPVVLQVIFLGAPTLCALCGAAAMTVVAPEARAEER